MMIRDRVCTYLVLLINFGSCLDQLLDYMEVTVLTGQDQCSQLAILRVTNHQLIITFYCNTDTEVCTD